MEFPTPLVARNIHQARILIVDDHPGTADMLARAITQIGPELEVISATSGKAALERVTDGAVDLLITDMMMPEMNGLELIEKLRMHPGGRPSYTILITAYDVPGLNEMARRLRVNETIIKPIHPERIREIVGRALGDLHRSQPEQTEDVHSFKILVADDKPDNVMLLTRYLKDKGYGMIKAADGVETLEKIRAEMPDLVLLDVNMPKKDGFSVLREMRADPAIAHIPVIILTANRLDSVDVQTGLNLGADDYVMKPFDRRELMARIQTKLRVKGADDEMRRRNRQLNILIDTAKIINSPQSLNETLAVVLRYVVLGLGVDAGSLFDFDNEVSYNNPDLSILTDSLQLKTLLNEMKKPEEALLLDDEADKLRWPLKGDIAIRAMLLIPVKNRENRLIGALTLMHEQTGYLRQEHIPLLQAVANQLALAMENARLVGEVQGDGIPTQS